MTVYVIVQLKMIDRAVYDRYQARFLDVFRKFGGRLLSADEHPAVLEGAWDRDKLVLMSFPDEAAFRAWSELAGISGDIERPQSRRASGRAAGEGAWVNLKQATSSLFRRAVRLPGRRVDRYQNGPNPKPKVNGAGLE